jgi:O-methyltransferase involved in polyketide biosynthesis
MASKPKMLLPEETRRAVQRFVESPETQTLLKDPKAQKAVEDSCRTVRRLAEERRNARQITPEMLYTVIGPGG